MSAYWTRRLGVLGGLAVLLAANYYLRSTLEEAPQYLYSFLERFYPKEVPILFGELPVWRLFLPLKEIGGGWVTSTLVLIHVAESAWSPATVWYLVNAAAILVAFGTTWVLFQSAVFSFTFAICIGFGTQFYHAYAVTGGIASYLVVSYHMLLLFTAVQLVRGAQPAWAWAIGMAVSLALNIFGYEGWLDVLTLVWVALPVVYVGLRRMDRPAEARRFLATTAVLTASGIGYVIIKLSLGFGQGSGSESDVLFNYDSWWLIADDFISNVFTHTYLSVSNFLPPSLVGASAFYQLGPQRLIDAQHQYHEPFLYLVPMSQVFLWRYYAGAALVLLGVALAHTMRRSWRQPSAWTLVLMAGLLMMLVPGATHMLIKFRPMNAMPVMTYHVTVGVLGAALVISWLVTTAWRDWRNRTAAAGVVLAVWAIVFYGALARPPYLAHMAAQSGLGNLLYPNPMNVLVEKLGGTYTTPAGLLSYQLMPYRLDDQISSARLLLGDLPDALPPLDQWTKTADQVVVATGPDGLSVTGDATQYGYQLMTPPIAVTPGADYIVRVKLEVQDGRVCAGILTGDQQRWVVPPDGGTVELSFNSAALDAVRVVIANCYLAPDNPVTKFRVAGGSYARLAARESRP